jgi:hypothetical protein
MSLSQRARHMDVTNTVDISDSAAVKRAIRSILDRLYPTFDFSPVDQLVQDFDHLYLGKYPGYRACDVSYHNAQHVLDVTLAMARLIDGYERDKGHANQLGPELILAGIACALFHDAGYIRKRGDNRNSNGAAYTLTHVSRSAKFMSEYFPTVGLQSLSPVCKRVVHFTGYEVEPDEIKVQSSEEYMLGSLLGTADLIAQMADVEYLKKCREDLYSEFVSGGIAGEGGLEGYQKTIYKSPQHLMELTPEFIRTVIDVRLEGYFNGAYRYAEKHFNGPNLYMEAIDRNRRELEQMLAAQ